VVVAAVDSAAVVVVVSLLVVVATVVATVAAVVDSHPTRCLGEGLSEVIGTLMLKVPGLASEIWTFDLLLFSFSLCLWSYGIWDVQ
jgi:hypothetical protein